jgi:hypothetical protein
VLRRHHQRNPRRADPAEAQYRGDATANRGEGAGRADKLLEDRKAEALLKEQRR